MKAKVDFFYRDESKYIDVVNPELLGIDDLSFLEIDSYVYEDENIVGKQTKRIVKGYRFNLIDGEIVEDPYGEYLKSDEYEYCDEEPSIKTIEKYYWTKFENAEYSYEIHENGNTWRVIKKTVLHEYSMDNEGVLKLVEAGHSVRYNKYKNTYIVGIVT